MEFEVGLELEGLGFDLSVMLSKTFLPLILEVGGWILDKRWEI